MLRWLHPLQGVAQHGAWAVTAAGRQGLRFMDSLAEELLGEMSE